MSQVPSTPPRSGAQPPLEPWAVASVVCLIVPFLGPMASIVLGSVGIRRITRATKPKRGMKLAWTGLLLGWVLLLAEGALIVQAAHYIDGLLRDSAANSIALTLRGGSEAGAQWMKAKSGAVPDSEVAALHDALSQAMGELKEVKVISISSSGWPGTVYRADFTAEADRGVAFGSAELVQIPTSTFELVLRLRRMNLEVGPRLIQVPLQPADATEGIRP